MSSGDGSGDRVFVTILVGFLIVVVVWSWFVVSYIFR